MTHLPSTVEDDNHNSRTAHFRQTTPVSLVSGSQNPLKLIIVHLNLKYLQLKGPNWAPNSPPISQNTTYHVKIIQYRMVLLICGHASLMVYESSFTSLCLSKTNLVNG